MIHMQKHLSKQLFSVLLFFIALPLMAKNINVPEELQWTLFSGRPTIPCPCPTTLSAHPDGSVFVGIDRNGSLGKGKGRGYILKFIDSDNDGVADSHTKFSPMESVRGLMAVGQKLYVLHSTWKDAKTYDTCYLSVLEDKDGDGIADGAPKTLISGISAPFFNNSRGVDHSTNGIRMGIDGWIYIAMGDFGIVNAQGTDGRKLTVLGGGVIRVRPNGTEMEEYIHGTRNICDIAIDPFMNVFTRGNTNDGGGWNIRFMHEIQSGEYGYPKLFKRYTDEILPALVDLGGGSGMGSMYFQEPGWPAKYNNVPLMGDWGRSHVYMHSIKPNGASFTQTEVPYITVGKMTDLDTDGSGRLFISSWEGSGFRGGKGGYVVQVTPKGWTYKPFPNLAKTSTNDLVSYLQVESATWRFHASREIVNRQLNATDSLLKLINNKKALLEGRVAAIFTLCQLKGKEVNKALVDAADDPSIREWALRAIADRIPQNDNVDITPFVKALNDSNPRVQVSAAVALGRIGNKAAAKHLIAVSHYETPAIQKEKEGKHATPNKDIILPHIAVQALIKLNATEACLAAVGSENASGAYWAMRYMHNESMISQLVQKLNEVKDNETEKKILKVLVRLCNTEISYDGKWWWRTRPDTRGPYYKPTAWSGTPIVETALKKYWANATDLQKNYLANLLTFDRVKIKALPIDKYLKVKKVKKHKETSVDLGKIINKKGQIGKMSIEDIIIALGEIKGDISKGEALFNRQGCIACHSYKKSQPAKGPDMGVVGGILSREDIAISILRPNASISQGFRSYTLSMKNGTVHAGFITAELDGVVTLRNIAGQVFKLKSKQIKKRQELKESMMPKGLAAGMSLKEFVNLVDWLKSKK